ncbi:MAG TPA: IucA/IucC family C-terminal-domain containing protein [Methylomirabilota bacterium]|nr:IucA/IucC family C-terminal-domain containing protein [Methylomirabilota bacterium]
MTLRDVRRWAGERRIGRARLARACEAAFRVAVSRLLQGIYREGLVPYTALWQSDAGRWFLDLGREPMLRAPVSGPLPFRRLELTGLPWAIVAGRRRLLHSTRTFLNALRPCLEPSKLARHFDRLAADFDNSFANLVLNRLIGQQLDAGAQAVEPVYEGHHYYPFPALRLGPSLQQVVECSNLCREAIDLTLVDVRPGLFDSTAYANHRACFRAWAGLSLPRNAGVVIPLHPWQLGLSPVVRELLKRRWIAVLDRRVKAIPLASQRTCRILRTGFDVKLPIAATLTGEDRLLYALNRANASAFSALARILLGASGESALDFQYDVASMAHAEPLVGTHLAAIIRAPVRGRAGEIVVPALNLWWGPRQARTLSELRRPERAYAFFRVYCRVLMRGVVDFYARWGMAFEPHLQNVYVALRDGMPSRMILRDLDSTILDPVRIPLVARAYGVRLAPGTWQQMPDFATGGRRLAHAMMYGHLGEVMSYLARAVPVDLARLSAAVEDTWDELIAQAASPASRRRVQDLRVQADTIGAVLWRRLTRATHLVFR